MDDLISRAALLKDLSYCAPELWQDEEYIKAKIMKQPAVDAAPVVRCRDCKHWICADAVNGDRYGDCTNGHSIISRHAMPNENYYCADGERRDDDAAD